MKPTLYIATSRSLLYATIATHTTCALGMCVADIHYLLAVSLVLMLMAHGLYVIKLHSLRQHRHSVTVLQQDCDTWLYALHDGRLCRGKLSKQRSYRSKFMLILYMQHFNGFRYIIVPRDSLSTAQYRYLAYHLT